MRMSASKLDTWMKCPLQAKFKYRDHLPTKRTSRMSFGVVAHAALEQYNLHGDVDKAIALFRYLWDNPETIGAEVEIWLKGTSHPVFMEKGIELLKNYHSQQGWDKRVIIAQEHRFLVPMGVHELTGIVDLIEVRKSGRGKAVVRVVDYKTGSKQPYKNTLRLNCQFTIYDYASRQPEFWLGNGTDFPPISNNAEAQWKAYKDLPRRSIWFHLLTCKEIDAGERDEQDFMRLYRAIKEIDKAWEADIFVPDISADNCVFCDFTEPCGVKIPEREYSEDDQTWF